MKTSSSLDTACAEIERSTYCFDGHKQLPIRRVPWEGVIGFDPDEIEHEKSLENSTASGLQEISLADAMRFQLHRLGESSNSDRPGYASVTSDYVDKCACHSGLPEDVCACHICNPAEEVERMDMLDAIRRQVVSVADAITELGHGFREFLELEAPELLRQAA